MRRIVLPDPRSVQLLKRQVIAAAAAEQAAAPRPRKPAATRRKPQSACACVKPAFRVLILLLIHIGPSRDLHDLRLRTEENNRTPKQLAAGGEKQRGTRDKSACAAAVRPAATGQPHDHSSSISLCEACVTPVLLTSAITASMPDVMLCCAQPKSGSRSNWHSYTKWRTPWMR